MEIFQKYKIVLASKSPRRVKLMTEMGFDVEQLVLDADESYSQDMDPREVALYIANKKMDAALQTYQPSIHEVILTADSIVICENRILEKPQSAQQAFEMLQFLRNKRHEVHTGISISFKNNRMDKNVCSMVYMKYFPDSAIKYYINTYKPYDKAGAYGIQEWLGHTGIEKIEGSYTNIMGLPTFDTFNMIQRIIKKSTAK